MQKSYYNFESELKRKKGEYSIYNSRTGCLSLLDTDHFFQYTNYPNIPIDDKDFESQLIDCGYLVSSVDEEKEHIRYQMYKARYSSTMMSLTIAPTMACNFSCTYCYEKRQIQNNKMSKQVQDKILTYIEENADIIKTLRIQWYGGEPLLATNIIDRLNAGLLNICSANSISCEENIITNGFLLDKEHIEFLNNNQIRQVQVTVDGCELTHNRRRKPHSGQGSYRQIIDNLKLCKLYYNGQINLKVNVDKNNINELDIILEELCSENLDNYVRVYLGRVTDVNDSICGGSCISLECFAKENIDFIKRNGNLKTYLGSSYPHPIGNYCAADYNQSLIIAPNGDLYKCHMEIGQNDYCIGNILNSEKIDISKLQNTLFWDPTNDAICGQCKYLPICMGGCKKERKGKDRGCDCRKFILDSYLEDIEYIE